MKSDISRSRVIYFYDYFFSEKQFFIACEKLDNNIIEKAKNSLIDLFEIFCISRILDNQDKITSACIHDFNKRIILFEAAKKVLKKHFSGDVNETIVQDLKIIEKEHLIDFSYGFVAYFDLLTTYCDLKQLSKNSLALLISVLPLNVLASNKDFSKAAEPLLKESILNDPNSVQYLAYYYDVDGAKRKLWLPKLSKLEMSSLVAAYINSKKYDYGTLALLRFHKPSKDTYELSVQAKLMIKEAILNFDFNSRNYSSLVKNDFVFGIELDPNENSSEPSYISSQKSHIVRFPKRFFTDSNSDLEAFLKITHGFEILIKDDGCFHGCFNKYHVGFNLDDSFDLRYKNQYGNDSFDFFDHLNICAFRFIYDNFEKRGLSIENGLNNFIQKEVNPLLLGKDLRLSFIPEGSFRIRCEHLCIELQALLKKFRAFVQEGDIKRDIIELMEGTVKLHDVPSFITNKYVEPSPYSPVPFDVCKYLFTKMPISYSSKSFDAACLFDFIKDNQHKYSSFDNYSRALIDQLIDIGILNIKSDLVSFSDLYTADVWNRLYQNGFFKYDHLCDEKYGIKEVVDSYIENGWFSFKNGLFSNEEADYLSYWLDNSTFGNAKALRNKYAHGDGFVFSEEENRKNYTILLRLTMIISLKIYDDLSTFLAKKVIGR